MTNQGRRLTRKPARSDAFEAPFERLESRTLFSVIAPSDLTLTPQSPTSVQLHWADHDSSATGYAIFRSTDNITFTRITSVIDGAADSYQDNTVAPNKSYWYKVKAVAGTAASVATGAVKITTPLAAPTGLTATLSGVQVKLAWGDPNGTGQGYTILRSTDGVVFSTLVQLAAGSARAFTDGSASHGTTYYYEVQAFRNLRVSAPSAAATATTSEGAGAVTITTRFGSELVVTSYGVDTIAISIVGGMLSILADGGSFSHAILSAGLFIYDRAGNDQITIDSSVNIRTTVTSVGGGAATTVSSAGSDVSAWIDTTDIYSGSGAVHRIGALAGGVSKAAGASLANPTDSGSTTRPNLSLFGDGPAAGDVNQGAVGDCYFLSSLAAFATVNPPVIKESAVDLGDGTYIVRFVRSGAPVYVRVSASLPTGNFAGLRFAHPGAAHTVWAAVMEKAFAYFRTGANSYASISSGWMGEVYTDLGQHYSNFSLQTSADAFYTGVSNDLNAGLAVTFGTGSSAPNLVRGHAYTLVSAYIDESGIARYVIRNPWGVSGDALENSAGYATLTFAQMQANFVLGCQAA